MMMTLAGCAYNQPSVPPARAKPLDRAQISDLLAKSRIFNNNISGGLRYVFSPNGELEVIMRWMGATKKAQWTLEGDRLCITLKQDGYTECGGLYQLDAKQYYFSQSQYGEDYNTLILQ
jgi:hypothetical protein